MAIPDYATYKSRLAAPHNRLFATKTGTGGNLAKLESRWLCVGYPAVGAAPTTAVVPTSATTGGFAFRNSNGVQRFAQLEVSAVQAGAFILCDRLSHQGGLSGTTTGAQTTNLPTAALTRFTSGVGVFAAIETYTSVGATSADLTISYTNSAGTSGRTSIAVPFTTTGGEGSASRFQIVPWQSGDVGVKSVESLTLSQSTGNAGNFGVTLFKPIAGPFPYYYVCPAGKPFQFDAVLSGLLEMATIPDNACLFLIQASAAASMGNATFHIRTIEE